MSSTSVQTYHCICTELALAAHEPLSSLPTRKGDGATICKVTTAELLASGAVVLAGATFDGKDPVVVKLEDGFEKRYAARCKRCDVQIGYWLDSSQFEASGQGRREDVLYLLPGGLMSTAEMMDKKDMEKEILMVRAAAG